MRLTMETRQELTAATADKYRRASKKEKKAILDQFKCKVMNPAKALTLRSEGYPILGVDLTTIPGISVLHVQTIVAELGPDYSKFHSAAAFSSWMGLCPDNDTAAGKCCGVGQGK